jgi:hypothetical protein
MTIEFGELEHVDNGRAGGKPGRRRLVAGVAAAMLIAAAGGVGYGIGRGVDGDASTNDDTGAASVESDSGTEEARTPPTTGEPSNSPTATSESVSDAAAEGGDRGDIGIRSSGGPGYAAFGSQPMETLFERTTDVGFELRAQLGQIWDEAVQDDWGAGDWRPAPWCFESGQLRVSIAGNGVVDVGGVPWYAEPFKGRSVSWLQLGGTDGSPQWVVVTQSPPGATNVRVTFADGTIDSVAPQGGIAVLTAPGEPAIPVTEGGYTYYRDPTPSFEVTFEGGAEPTTIGSDGVGTWDDPEFRESCTPPPPPLPEPGGQPADPAAGEAEIRAAMSSLYGAIGSGDVESGLIDDPTGVADAREQVQAGGYADDAAGASATIDELVFTAPDEAWFRYSIDTPGNDFDNRYGIAVLIDGVWKITRATVCQDLLLAGGDCGEGWQQIYPPSMSFGMGGDSVTPVTTVLLDD